MNKNTVAILLDALAKISLAEADSSTGAAEKVRDMARIARRAIAAVDLSNLAEEQVVTDSNGHGRA